MDCPEENPDAGLRAGVAYVVIADPAGRMIFRRDATGPALRVDVTGLTQGTYTITLLGKDRHVRSRFVKR